MTEGASHLSTNCSMVSSPWISLMLGEVFRSSRPVLERTCSATTVAAITLGLLDEVFYTQAAQHAQCLMGNRDSSSCLFN